MTSVPPEFPDANIPPFPNLSLVRWQEINRRFQEYERRQRQIEHIMRPSNLNRLQEGFRAAGQVAENMQRSQDIIGRVQIFDARLQEIFRLADQESKNIQRWQDIIGGIQISDEELVAQSIQAAQLARESPYDSIGPLFETVQQISEQIELPAKGDVGEDTGPVMEVLEEIAKFHVELVGECQAINENLEGIRHDNQNTQYVNRAIQGTLLAITVGLLLLEMISFATG